METIGKWCACLTRRPLKQEENEEIDSSLLKSFLLLQTVVPAVGNIGERVLPTVQALSEEQNASGEGGR